MKLITRLAGAIARHFYIIRCTEHDPCLAIGYRGALHALRMAGPDASVHTVAGQWIAGRRITL